MRETTHGLGRRSLAPRGHAPVREEGKAGGMLGRRGTTGSECLEALVGGGRSSPNDGVLVRPRPLLERRRAPSSHPTFLRFSGPPEYAGRASAEVPAPARPVGGAAWPIPFGHVPAAHLQPHEQVREALRRAARVRFAGSGQDCAAEFRKGAGGTRHTPCKGERVRDGAFPTAQLSAWRVTRARQRRERNERT